MNLEKKNRRKQINYRQVDKKVLFKERVQI